LGWVFVRNLDQAAEKRKIKYKIEALVRNTFEYNVSTKIKI